MPEEKIEDILKEYDEGVQTALVCEESAEAHKTIAAALKDLKYAVDTSPNTDDAFEKVKFNNYDLVFLNERFGGSNPEDNVFLQHMQRMPMTTRRNIFLALMGKNLETMDNMQAFDKSANVVINESDLPNLRAILKKSIAANDQFYKVFKESLVKLGKA